MEKDVTHVQEGKPLSEETNMDVGPPSKPKSKWRKKLLLKHLVAFVLIGALVGALCWWRDSIAVNQIKTKDDEISAKEKTITSLKKQLAEAQASIAESSSESDSTECTEVAPNASAIESIEASITSGNTAALASYSATSINVILAASEGIGPSSQTAMVSSVSDFISDATSPWDFSLPVSELNAFSSGGYGQYFPDNAVVGQSGDGKVISFSFDCNGDIDTVFMSVGAEIL